MSEKTQTVLDVVIHQGGGFRFGVVNKEYANSPAKTVKILGLPEPIVLNVEDCYYSNGSIYSKEISEWIVSNGFGRTKDDPIPLLKFYYEQNGEEDIFEFAGDSFCKKRPRQNVLISKDSTEITYETGQLVEKLWGEETAPSGNNSGPKISVKAFCIIAFICWYFYVRFWGFWAGLWSVLILYYYWSSRDIKDDIVNVFNQE